MNEKYRKIIDDRAETWINDINEELRRQKKDLIENSIRLAEAMKSRRPIKYAIVLALHEKLMEELNENNT